jgi:potassium efflux system protein
MTPLRPLFPTSLLTILAVVVASSPAAAQMTAATALGAVAQEDVEAKLADVQMKIAAVEDAADLDADTKAKVLDRYKSATRTLTEIAKTAENANRFAQDAKAARAEAAKLQRDLADLLKRPALGRTVGKPLAELDAELATREANITMLKQALAALDADRQARAARKAEIRKLQADAETRRAELRRQSEAPAAAGEPASLTEARRLDAGLKLLAFERLTSMLDLEWAKYKTEEAVDLPGRREEFKRAELALEEEAVGRLSGIVGELRAKEAAEKVEKARQQSVLANPLLQGLAKDNQADAEQNAQLSKTIAELEAATANTKGDLAQLDAKFADIRDKERQIGLTQTIGFMLREERASFPDLRRFDQELEDRQELIERIRLEMWQCDDLIAGLLDAPTYVKQRARESGVAPDSLSAEQWDELKRAADELLRSRREVLEESRRLKQQHFETLGQLDFTDRLYVQRSREYLHYINERILWTRSADPLTVDFISSDASSRAWLFSLDNWRGMLTALAADPLDHPFAFWPTLVAILALGYVRLRIRPRLRALGGQAAKRGFLRYGPTTQAAVLTLMAAVAVPAVLLFLSWRLAEAADPKGFARAVAAALQACAAVVFPVELLREACRHMGLAEAHFGWPARAVQHLRRSLTWMKTLGLPVTFLAVLSHQQDPLGGGLPTERVLFIAGMALTGLTVHRLLSSRSELSKGFLVEQPASLFSRYRRLWYSIVVIVPLGFAGLSAAGYHYSATQVAYRLLWTLWLAAGAVLIRAMAVRWVVLSRRRLLLDQAYQRRSTEEPREGETPKPPAVEETDVAKTTAQTRKLVDIVMLGFAATALAMIWADTLPAFGLLDRPLWTVSEAAAVAAPETAGDPAAIAPAVLSARPTISPEVGPAGQSVTTLDLAVAIMIALFTLLASRNLPGLMEMSVLNRLPVDQATRYAATRLGSYAIVIVGLLMSSNRLGLQWQNVQWLAAALTVGLGFGLQEVFANFVSGLIVLFERPVRVGDVVTISDVTGVVSRIRMRATTITNWDRKEFIVPNKEFITGRVLNWTLSDAVNRVTINVGVAYGTDMDQAREILLGVCRDHPLVLKEPAPMATFEGFGDSTLNMVMRCFLPSLEQRSDVIHELHTQIDREFRKAGIDMAFPQRDLHIRSVNGLTLPLPMPAGQPSARPIERAAG